MTYTTNLRRQHEELTALAMTLLGALDAPHLETIRKTLTELAGKLSVHGAVEDKSVYPRLAAHSDEAIRATATRLQREFAPVYGAVLAYTQRWVGRGTIEADSATFVKETHGILAALAERMGAEERELYDRVDALAD